MKQDKYVVGEKEYSREQLIAFGKEHYPRFYWIARGIGIILLFVAILVIGLIGLVMLILNKAGVFDPDFPIWVFYIPMGVFGVMGLAGIICIVASFLGRSEERYINHALAYLTKVEIKQSGKNDPEKIERVLNKIELETLQRYERLLKGGVITQEEFDQKKEELLGK